MNEFIKGMDVSTLLELEKLGAKYFDQEKEGDLLTILKGYGVNYIRLRLWVDPYSEDGRPYGAGTNDFRTVTELAKRIKEKNMGFLLNFHYSDFWTDPAKQFIPKKWRGYSDEQLEQAVYAYTKETLEQLKFEGLFPDMVQVGNELTNGLLWPNGKKPNYERIAQFVNAGIRGVRSVNADIPVMLHLDNGSDNEMYRDWFDHFIPQGEEFQVIGLSFYPIWNGKIQDLKKNLDDLARRYQKELVVVEVAAGFSTENYAHLEGLEEDERKGMATTEELAASLEYPLTVEGQCDFMKHFLEEISKTENGLCRGFFYWEPGWIPVKGSGWATEASLEYIQDKGPCGNEWANQTLFDYNGKTLPSLQVIKEFQE